MSWTLIERADSRSPGGLGASYEGARSWALYNLSVDTVDDVHQHLLWMLGGVSMGAGKLNRRLPKANPFVPWHYASRLVSVQGVGVNAVADTADLAAEAVALQYALYSRPRGRYEVKVEFEPRDLDVLPDAEVTAQPLTWTAADGTSVTSDSNDEYLRFTNDQGDSAPSLSYYQHGQVTFKRANTALRPHGYTASGFPFTVLPDGSFTLVWHMVPYSLCDDFTHWMHTLVGTVNQRRFFNRPPGSLLYMGAKWRRYLPPVLPPVAVLSGRAFKRDRVADVTFNFLQTTRQVTDPPSLPNANWVAAGWNCEPFLPTGEFFYAGPGAGHLGAGFWRPRFYSAPHELLFAVPTTGYTISGGGGYSLGT